MKESNELNIVQFLNILEENNLKNTASTLKEELKGFNSDLFTLLNYQLEIKISIIIFKTKS